MSIKYHPNIDLDKLKSFDAKSHKSEVPPELFHDVDVDANKRPTKLDKESIFAYTSGAIYRQMNHLVRQGGYLGFGQDSLKDDKIKKSTKQLQSAFNRLKLGEDTTLYRGIRSNEFRGVKPGQIIINKGFTSTTTDKRVATTAFGGNNHILMHITAPKGIPAIDTKGMSDINESEIILPAHSHFLVHHVKKDGNSTHIFASWIGHDEETANKNIK